MRRRFLVSLVVLASVGTVSADEAPDLSGAELYAVFCSSCHGEYARGDGPIAPLLKTNPSDLTKIATRRDGRFSTKEIHRIVDGRTFVAAHGTRDMPVWGNELYAYDGRDAARRRRANEAIAKLVAYLGTLQTIRVD